MRAWLNLRNRIERSGAAVESGLKRLGFEVAHGMPARSKPGEVFVSWNLIGAAQHIARRVADHGGRVLVLENGYLGNSFAGDRWFALSRDRHNGAGRWPAGGHERWDALGVELPPWRAGGDEIVLLPQRGIGLAGVAMPRRWTNETVARLRSPTPHLVRVRAHPGGKADVPSLKDDLANAWAACTWGSGAALKALLLGVPVFYSFGQWIGAPAARPFKDFALGPLRDDAARLAMFRRLAWAMWRHSEIESGEAFAQLLAC